MKAQFRTTGPVRSSRFQVRACANRTRYSARRQTDARTPRASAASLAFQGIPSECVSNACWYGGAFTGVLASQGSSGLNEFGRETSLVPRRIVGGVGQFYCRYGNLLEVGSSPLYRAPLFCVHPRTVLALPALRVNSFDNRGAPESSWPLGCRRNCCLALLPRIWLRYVKVSFAIP
jgi:hypothetical protein